MGYWREKREFVCFCGEEWMGVRGSREREGSEREGNEMEGNEMEGKEMEGKEMEWKGMGWKGREGMENGTEGRKWRKKKE